jgi:hypothetical protein
MVTELDVLELVGDRLTGQGVAFMLTGSFAMAHYSTPRMTRDLDIVVALAPQDVMSLVTAFAGDFYVDADAARDAVAAERLFNLMHYGSGIKVDLIVRPSSEYRLLEFSRRRRVELGAIRTWIVSREDLILSKLVWARDASSELQLRDVRQLLVDPVDAVYLRRWAPRARSTTAAREHDTVNDTSETVARLVADRHGSMTPEERMRVAASLFETARAIIESSLPRDLTREQRRYRIAKRLYGDELPEAALLAHARYLETQ